MITSKKRLHQSRTRKPSKPNRLPWMPDIQESVKRQSEKHARRMLEDADYRAWFERLEKEYDKAFELKRNEP